MQDKRITIFPFPSYRQHLCTDKSKNEIIKSIENYSVTEDEARKRLYILKDVLFIIRYFESRVILYPEQKNIMDRTMRQCQL